MWIETGGRVLDQINPVDFTRWDGGCGLKLFSTGGLLLCPGFHPLGWRVWIETDSSGKIDKGVKSISPAGMAGVD